MLGNNVKFLVDTILRFLADIIIDPVVNRFLALLISKATRLTYKAPNYAHPAQVYALSFHILRHYFWPLGLKQTILFLYSYSRFREWGFDRPPSLEHQDFK
jgi:hypothetical protein